MIKKLKWKFTLVAVAAISIVLISLVVGINAFFINNAKAGQDAVLRLISENEGTYPKKAPEEKGKFLENINFTDESPFDTRFFSVWTDESGNVTKVHMDNIFAMTDEKAEEMVHRVENRRGETGDIDHYRYIRTDNGSSRLYIFLDVTKQVISRNNLMRISFLVTAAGILGAFVLAYLFSGSAVSSAVKNMEAQKRFITDASHELKTPLTAISAYTNMLKGKLPDDSWVEGMEAETKRLNNLVVNLVELSRWDEERPLADAKNFSVTDALWDVVGPYKSIAVGKGREIAVNIDEDLNSYGDEISIQKAWSLLLENAIRHSTENSIICVNAHRKKQKIEIDIINECIFDPGVDLNRIFDRFYRPDESRSRQSGGNGVGLSIVKAIVTAHGGTVKADRPDNDTIRFRMTIKAV